jgi:type I restriction enzyme M protein
MLDFTKVDFNKYLSLTPKSTLAFETKWDTKKLSDIALVNPSKTEMKKLNESTKVSFVEMASVSDEGYIAEKEDKKYQEIKKGSYTYFAENDIILAKITPCMENGKCAIATDLTNKIGFGSSEFHVIRVGSEILNRYLFELLNQEEVRLVAEKNMTGSSGHRRVPKEFYESLKIPFLPIEIQTELVNECNTINKEAEKAKKVLNVSEEEIEALFQRAFSKADKTFRINNTDVFELSIGKRVLKNEINQEGIGIPVFSANVFEPFGHINKELIKDFNRPSVLWGIDGDWMVNCLPKNIPFYPTDHCGVLRIKGDTIHPKYVAWVLEKEGERVRFSRTNRASMDSMRGINVKAPSQDIQIKLIKEVEKREKKINASQEIINGIAKRKEEVIKSYLMDKASSPKIVRAAEPKVDYKKK